jgi:tRNA G10  N-methylase Trm11
MRLRADARHLPFPDKTVDLLFFAPPWDDPEVVAQAKHELIRVCKRKGRMAMVLPHAELPDQATLLFTNRDWTERQSFICEKPRQRRGPRYWSMSPEFVAKVLNPYPRKSVILDPFMGMGTVPETARSMGFARAFGLDIDPEVF